jgi:hypothetical protein
VSVVHAVTVGLVVEVLPELNMGRFERSSMQTTTGHQYAGDYQGEREGELT